MSDENRLVVKPELDLTIGQEADQNIVNINNAFKNLYDERRQQIINRLRQSPSIFNLVSNAADSDSYRVVFSPEVLRKIENGAASWDKTADGFIGATIRNNKNGQVIAQVKLEEIPPDLLTSISQVTIQRTLAEIVQRLEMVDQKITSVLEGQRNDRLAMMESGINNYKQAIEAKDPVTRKQLLIQAVIKLDLGRQQLIDSLESDIEFAEKLPRTFWQMVVYSPFRDVSEEVERKAKPVQQSFQAVIRASYVLALAFEALGEMDSLQVSFQPLREMLLKVGEKGERIARLLPYNSVSPPEELWHKSVLQLADNITQADKQLETINSQIIEIPFEGHEIIGEGKNDRTGL